MAMTDFMVVMPPVPPPVTVYVFACEICGGREHSLWEHPRQLLEFFDCFACGHRISYEEAIRRPLGGLPLTWFLISMKELGEEVSIISRV